MGGIHDQLFKEVGMAFPADLVTLTLPYLAAQIDLSALVFVPGRERFADVLRGRRWFPDLVADVVSRCDPEEVSFGRSLWTFRYHGLGLSRALAREYLERKEPLAWAFAVLMRPDGYASRGRLAVACLRRILKARGLGHERRVMLLNFVHTYVKMDEQSAPEYEALLREADNEEVNDMVRTWADELREEGREEGRQEDTEKLRNVVLQKLAQRFGSLPNRTRRAIASVTSFDELSEIATRVYAVESPEELLAG